VIKKRISEVTKLRERHLVSRFFVDQKRATNKSCHSSTPLFLSYSFLYGPMTRFACSRFLNKSHSNTRYIDSYSTSTAMRLIMLLVLASALGFAISNTDNVSAATSTISLAIDNTTVSVDVAPVNSYGTFAKSGNSTITASTNNATGYEIRIAGSNSTSADLINTSDSNAKLNSISAATTEAQFKALSGTSYNGKWGYLPSKYNSAANSDFLPAPNTTGDLINKTECANGASSCPAQDTYTLAIGARVDSSTKMGTYNNTFVVLATANAIPYTIIYDDNVIGNMPVDVDSSTFNTTVPISSNTPTRNGYTFLGWCSNVPIGGGASCSGITYAPGSNWTINQTGTNNLHLYAMWSKNTSIDDIDYMQDFNVLSSSQKTSVLNSMETGKRYFLVDIRDNEVYSISKLADGKVWMLDNLRLIPDAYELTEDNTNASDTTISYLKNGGGTTSDQYAITGFGHWTSGYSYSQPLFNEDSTYFTITSYGAGSGKIGVYYNYCAASAGSYCYGNGTSSGTSTGDATEDICPAGWRMPTGGSSGEYQALYTAYSSDATNFRNALSTPLSGYFYNGSAYYQGDYGYFWSSTRYSNNGMRDLIVVGSDVDPAGGISRYLGLSVRCVLK